MNSEQKQMVLRCTACGAPTPAYEQWPNQDIGYGICPRCRDMVVKKYGERRLQWLYGNRGVHHSIEESNASTA